MNGIKYAKIIVGITMLFTVFVQCGGVFAEGSNEKIFVSYPCHRLKCKPALDGKINDASAWCQCAP